MMFLTANRVYEISPAIASRIYVKISYDAFAQEQGRRIWEYFLGKGNTFQAQTIYSSNDLEYLVRKKA